MISDRGPTEINRDCGNRLLYGCRTFVRHRRSNHRRGNDDGLTAYLRPGFRRNIEVRVSFKSKSLDRLATYRPQLIVTRSFIYDGCLVVSDVRDIRSLTNDGDVAFGRKKCLLHPRRAKFAAGDEAVLIRADVIITVRPIVNAGALIEARFRR